MNVLALTTLGLWGLAAAAYLVGQTEGGNAVGLILFPFAIVGAVLLTAACVVTLAL